MIYDSIYDGTNKINSKEITQDLSQSLHTGAQRDVSSTDRQHKMSLKTQRLQRKLEQKNIPIERPPGLEENKHFWQNILEQELEHSENTPWIKDQEEELKHLF